MKKYNFLFAILIFFVANAAQAQLSYTLNSSAYSLAAQLLDTTNGGNVTITNATLVCDSSAVGSFISSTNLGLSDGIILGNGSLADLIGPSSILSNTNLGKPGDASITTMVMAPSYDACVLDFDLQTPADTIVFEYVFGSDEYPSFNCTQFNDAFAFWISGPGYTAPGENIALVPNSTQYVGINTINDGSHSGCGDTTYYVKNVDTFLTINGFTMPLWAVAPVASGQIYHLKLAIADVSDYMLNSYVVIKGQSLAGKYAQVNTAIADQEKNSPLTIYPTVVENELIIVNNSEENWQLTISNIHGQKVMETKIANDKSNNKISLSALPAGIYVVSGVTNTMKNNFVQKFNKL